MAYEYYLDESGHTGDLVNANGRLDFGNQPLFALACIGIMDPHDLEELTSFAAKLKTKHDLAVDELKSKDLYFDKPEVILELAQFFSKKRLPLLVELVDKRYCVAVSIVTHHILPAYSLDLRDDSEKEVLNILADYLTTHLPDNCYRCFFTACQTASEKALMTSMQSLKDFCLAQGIEDDIAQITVMAINTTIDDYQDMKKQVGEENAVKLFIPIPDTASNGKSIRLLPHVHSIYSLFARLNKYHQGELKGVTLWHDVQDELKEILLFCAENVRNPELVKTAYETPHANYKITQPLTLDFDKSENRIGIQLADLFAGFFNRYVSGVVYKGLQVDDIYHEIFLQFRVYFRLMSPLGVNFVLPESRRQVIFNNFMI